MADLDEQLLALAGDDSSENEDPQPTSTPHKAASPTSSPPKPSNLRRNSASKPSTTQKMSHKGTGSGSRPKRSRREDSEEGEAYVLVAL